MGRPSPFKGMTREQIKAAAAKNRAERDAKRGTRKTAASSSRKKAPSAPTRKAAGRIKVRQSTVDQLNRGTMAGNIAKANSGKASPEFVEAARRFYPGKIKPTGKKAPALKKKAAAKKTTAKKAVAKKVAKKAAPKFTGTRVKASANKKSSSLVKSSLRKDGKLRKRRGR